MAYLTNKEYSWPSFTAFYLGRIITGIQGIEYKKAREKEPIYGAGSDPVAIQWGNTKIEGKITLLQSELEALNKFAKDQGFNDALDLEFDITATYTAAQGPTIKDNIIGVSFTELPKTINQNDKMMKVELPYVAVAIEYQK